MKNNKRSFPPTVCDSPYHAQDQESGGPSGSFEEMTYQYLLHEQKTILVNSDINGSLIERLVIPIILLNKKDDEREASEKGFDRNDEPISLLINSNGGLAHEVLSAVSVIMNSKTPVHTYALGRAMSGGFYLLISGHRRFAQPFSTVCYHQIQGASPSGPAQTGVEYLAESYRLQSAFEAMIHKRTKIKKKKLEDVNTKKIDWYFSQEELINLGIVDDFSF